MIAAPEEVSTIDPPLPAAIMGGIAALTVMKVPVSVTSMSSRNWSRSMSQVSCGQEMIAAFAATMSSRPPSSASPASSTDRTAARSRMSALRAMIRRSSASTCLTVCREVSLGRQRVAEPVRGGARVERDDVGALLREPDRVRAALPARRPGDEGDLAVK